MPDLSETWFGYLALIIFVAAYLLVVFEEATSLRKSKPVLLAAGLIWALIGMGYAARGMGAEAEIEAYKTIAEFGELFLFLLVAITYVNTLEERRVFAVLRSKLVNMHLSYRQLFWLTGTLAFSLSGLLDNLTTALVMGSVVLSIGNRSPKFVALGCINIVVAANAGGVFFTLRRHHKLDGLAGRQVAVHPVLPAVPALPRQLAHTSGHHALRCSPQRPGQGR